LRRRATAGGGHITIRQDGARLKWTKYLNLTTIMKSIIVWSTWNFMRRLQVPRFIDICQPGATRGFPFVGSIALTENIRMDASEAFVMSATLGKQ
jgi:hypothetical protein